MLWDGVEPIYKLEANQTLESRKVKNYSKQKLMGEGVKIDRRKKFRKGIRIDEVIHEQLLLRRKKLKKAKNQKKEKFRKGIRI